MVIEHFGAKSEFFVHPLGITCHISVLFCSEQVILDNRNCKNTHFTFTFLPTFPSHASTHPSSAVGLAQTPIISGKVIHEASERNSAETEKLTQGT